MKNILQIIWVTACIVSLSGCAPSTVQGLRDKNSGKSEFEVDENYQAVYRKIITKARDYDFGLVFGDLYTDIKSGTITIVRSDLGDVTPLMAIDIESFTKDKTKVTLWYSKYYGLGALKKHAEMIEKWAKE